jgi:hypothetical protein
MLDIEQIIATIREYDAKQHKLNIKLSRDIRLRNTRLLLQNYNYFKVHAEESVYSADQLQDIDEIDDYKPHILLQSIKKSSHKTFIVLKHINKMLVRYKNYADMGSDKSKREYRVMVKHFIDGVKTSDIAGLEGVDERTIRRDIVDAIQHFSCFLFGFNSIADMSEECP